MCEFMHIFGILDAHVDKFVVALTSLQTDESPLHFPPQPLVSDVPR